MKLLVLDDEPWSVSWIKPFVARHGIEPRFVSTFDEAVKESKTVAPDVAVIDIMIGQSGESFKGATLAKAEEDWEGLKFLRHLRVERKLSVKRTTIIVYTVLDTKELADIVERAYVGLFCPKSDVTHFRRVLNESIVNKLPVKDSKRKE